MTRAAFQAVASLNEQATDPKSHTLVRITYTLSSPVLSPANSDGRPSAYLFGEIQTTITLKKVSCGTELNIVQEGVPEVIPAEACYLGWQESLILLQKLVEPEIPD